MIKFPKVSFAKHWKKIVLGLIVLLILGVISRLTILKPQPKYELATAEVKTLTQTLEVSGEIAADRKASLKFQTGGKLAWVGVKTGDAVSYGQAIASLDKAILQKQLQKTLNDYQSQRWDFDQIRENNQVTSDNYDEYSFSNTIERLIEQEQFSLNKSVLDVEIQDLTNKLATLVSPLKGIVTRVDTPVVGINVTPTDTIEVVDPQTLYFAVEIDETDIGSIALGQKADIVLEAFPNETITSEVMWIDFAASTSDSGSTVFIAKLKLSVSDQLKFRLGLTGDATINLVEKPQVLTVPLDAVEDKDDKQIVKLLRKGKVVEKAIELGLETEDEAEVIAGLSPGDIVITGEKNQ